MAERLGRAVDDKYYSLPLPQDETDKNPNLKQHPRGNSIIDDLSVTFGLTQK